jgi:hypothetical protein
VNSPNLSLPLALDGGGWSTHCPSRFRTGNLGTVIRSKFPLNLFPLACTHLYHGYQCGKHLWKFSWNVWLYCVMFSCLFTIFFDFKVLLSFKSRRMSHGCVVSSQPVVLLESFVIWELPYTDLNCSCIVNIYWPLVGFLLEWTFLVRLIMETSRHLHVL